MIRDEGNCSCKTCEYGRRIQGLIGRQATIQDQKLVRELYESFADVSDYNALCTGRWKELKPVLHLLRSDHSLNASAHKGLEENERCKVCAILDRIL